MSTNPTLTSWEVEEFISELQQRPRRWLGKDKLWIRRRNGENEFAIKFINGLPHDMSTLYIKVLNGQDEQQVQRYVEWLLSKFTGHKDRKTLEQYLSLELPGCSKETIERISRNIHRPEGLDLEVEKFLYNVGTFVAVDTSPSERVTEKVDACEGHGGDDLVKGDILPRAGSNPAPLTPQRTLSRYLQNLTRKR